MKKFEKPTLEIIYFNTDIITTSDHDNGFFDGGLLAHIIDDIKDKLS